MKETVTGQGDLVDLVTLVALVDQVDQVASYEVMNVRCYEVNNCTQASLKEKEGNWELP